MRLIQSRERLVHDKLGDILGCVMHALCPRGVGIPLMAEGFINLAQYAYRNMSEIQIIPIHRARKCQLNVPARDGVVAFENSLQMVKEGASGFLAACSVRQKVKTPPLARRGIVCDGRNQRQQVAVEGFIKPDRSVRRTLGIGKHTTEVVVFNRRTNLSQVLLTNDSSVDQKPEKECAARSEERR